VKLVDEELEKVFAEDTFDIEDVLCVMDSIVELSPLPSPRSTPCHFQMSHQITTPLKPSGKTAGRHTHAEKADGVDFGMSTTLDLQLPMLKSVMLKCPPAVKASNTATSESSSAQLTSIIPTSPLTTCRKKIQLLDSLPNFAADTIILSLGPVTDMVLDKTALGDELIPYLCWLIQNTQNTWWPMVLTSWGLLKDQVDGLTDTLLSDLIPNVADVQWGSKMVCCIPE
jgi:hypothetical protein